MATELPQHRRPVHPRRGQIRVTRIRREARPRQSRGATLPQRQRGRGFLRGAVRLPEFERHGPCSGICEARRSTQRPARSYATLVPHRGWW